MGWLVSGHPYVNVFRKMGFVQTINNIVIHFHPKTEPVFKSIEYSPERLVFSFGDSDLY